MTTTEYIARLLEAADYMAADPRQEAAVRVDLAHDLASGHIGDLRVAGTDLRAVDELIDELADGTYDLTPAEVAQEIAPNLDPTDHERRSRLEAIVTASRIAYPTLDEQDAQAEFVDTHTHTLLTQHP